MSSKAKVRAHLASVPLFAQCTKKELDEIARLTTPLFFEAGETLIREGQFAQQMMVIMDGTATVRRKGRKVATLSAGAVIGELALFTHQPRNATVTADTRLEALVVDPAAFSKLLDDVPSVNKKILATVAARLADLENPH